MCPAAESFAEALDWTAEVYRAAGALMEEAGTLAGVADEGGWWPAFSTNEQALDTLVRAIERAGFTPGRGGGDRARHRRLGVRPRRKLQAGAGGQGAGQRRHDRAADRLDRPLPDRLDRGPAGRGRRRRLRRVHPRGGRRGCRWSATISWSPTPARVREAAARGAANTVLLKPNQRGTLTETFDGLAGGAGGRLRRHRLGALRRDRGHHDRASRGRLGRRTAQGRQLRARRADGEMERGAAHRGGAVARAGSPVRRCWGGRDKNNGTTDAHRCTRMGPESVGAAGAPQ